MREILFVFGTRPEAIKLAPVIKRLRMNNDGRNSERIESIMLGMHRANDKDNNEKGP